jgi:hypothetical protein
MQSLVNSVIISFLVMLSSCVWDGGRIGLRGEGPVVERKLSLEKIKGISLPGSAKVYPDARFQPGGKNNRPGEYH